MRIILLGPPGSGKGTQGEFLTKLYSLKRLSVGALLRRIISEGTSESVKINRYVNNGLPVPPKLLFKHIKQWIKENPDNFVIDNLPRGAAQLKEFKKLVKMENLIFDRVFHFNVPKDVILKRLARRRTSRKTCGKERLDETPKIIEKRYLEGYKKDIDKILAYFNKLGVLEEINGNQGKEEVFNDLTNKLER